MKNDDDGILCDRCGEGLDTANHPDDSWAELYKDDRGLHGPVIVHAEPCAEELIRKGWQVA
jgi:hypothetical protein